MLILSHRGLWYHHHEKNTFEAFKKSFSADFGIETDLRDYKEEISVSHDMANENCLALEELFSLYVKNCKNLPLALNIKADGLQLMLKKLLDKYKISNYFVFDMSVPDALTYIDLNFNVFTRQSEYEINPSFYDKACGVWMDEFYSHWIDENTLKKHLDNNKLVCIVSPELHKRDYQKEWQEYKNMDKKYGFVDRVMICTDYPEKAKEFFNA
ncbi:hypothetical protein ACRCD5_07155 [Campylobacter taeniopygiae]|uniref:hypothetical protein n=1 Tax=Campylobacter taeniopygiae TaxID=2510188 RepID=UPI003D6A0446